MSGKPCSKHKGFYITEKHGEKINTYQVCEDCLYLNASKSNVEIVHDEKKCDNCGKTLSEIVKNSRVGCAKCYEQFHPSIDYIIAAVQSTSDFHKGRTPQSWRIQQAQETDPIKFATELSQKIKIAKRDENYREAAKIKSYFDIFQQKLSEYYEANEERAPSLRKELADLIYNYRESELT